MGGGPCGANALAGGNQAGGLDTEFGAANGAGLGADGNGSKPVPPDGPNVLGGGRPKSVSGEFAIGTGAICLQFGQRAFFPAASSGVRMRDWQLGQSNSMAMQVQQSKEKLPDGWSPGFSRPGLSLVANVAMDMPLSPLGVP